MEKVDENAYILKFEEEEAIDKILQKTHKVGGMQLTVKKYIPPPPLPKYEDKVFIKGVSSSTTKDSLFNFLEAKSNAEPIDIIYGEEEGTALVTFDTKPDIEKLRQQCKKRTLEGNYLNIDHVTVTNTIVATGFKETTSEETLELYFDSKKKCGVDGVTKVKMNQQQNQCFISFDDYNSVDIVCNRKHKVDGVEFKVRIHQECLGNPADESQSLQFQQPDPVLIEHVDKWKLVFLKESPENQEKMNEYLRQTCAHEVSEGMIRFLGIPEVKSYLEKSFSESGLTATWAVTDGKSLKIYSLSDEELVKAVQHFRKLLSEVKIDVEDGQSNILKTQSWKDLIKSTQCLTSNKVVKIDETSSKITVYTTSAANIGMIRETLQDFLYKNAIKQQKINQSGAVSRLLKEHYRKEIASIERDLQNEHVTIQINDSELLLKGNNTGLSKANARINQLLASIVEKKHVINKAGIVQHIQSLEGKAKIAQVERTNAVVFTVNDNDDQSMDTKIIPQSLLAQRETATCTTASGQTIVTVVGDITELDFDVIVNAANKTLEHVGGLAEVIVTKGGQSIQQECSEYIRRRLGEKELLPGEIFCSKAGNLKCKLVIHAVGPPYQDGFHNEDEYLSECIEQSLKETAQRKLKSIAIPAIGTGNFGYPLHDACKVIVDSIKRFFKSNKSTSIQKVFLCDLKENTLKNFVTVLQTKFDRTNVKVIGQSTPHRLRQHRFEEASAMALSDDDFDDDYDDDDDDDMSQPSSGPIAITVLRGQVALQEVDAIVNSTSKDLQLTHGAVSQSLLNAGGKTLQSECTKKYPNGVNPGEIAVTNGGKLECKSVYHGALTGWSPTEAPKELEMFMTNCLAAATKSGFSSIAFPALGTGNLGYPKSEVARMMFSNVEMFGRNNPSTSITDVRFVIYEKDTEVLKAFEDEKRNGNRRKDKSKSMNF
ncbi:protein mono-ADP-ribosyltransferase PARP14-like [Mytilus californianus]|uniref:protein mono-ADP-ribosyltransferase PARP14-like n=1 Tax=Mytilus californianus TaxID=6549 RepID=UPI002248510F|nr:protein mono-ADP-ribosyltransferase PARP14-like [Mytilus californianus]